MFTFSVLTVLYGYVVDVVGGGKSKRFSSLQMEAQIVMRCVHSVLPHCIIHQALRAMGCMFYNFSQTASYWTARNYVSSISSADKSVIMTIYLIKINHIDESSVRCVPVESYRLCTLPQVKASHSGKHANNLYSTFGRHRNWMQKSFALPSIQSSMWIVRESLIYCLFVPLCLWCLPCPAELHTFIWTSRPDCSILSGCCEREPQTRARTAQICEERMHLKWKMEAKYFKWLSGDRWHHFLSFI